MPSQYMKFIRPTAIIIISILIATGLYLNRPHPEKLKIEPKTLLVNAIKVIKENLRVNVWAQGVISPSTRTVLIAEVAGKIVEVSPAFNTGGFFKKGEMLIKIDQRDYLANLKRNEAAVASARSKLATEQGLAEVAFQDWKKYKSNIKRSQAATDLALRKPQLDDAKANLSAAIADLDLAKTQLDRTTILAPYDGLMSSKSVDFGQYLNIGSRIGETFTIDNAELRLPLASNKLNYLQLPSAANTDKSNQPNVTLVADIGNTSQQWQGKIVRTEGVFDERSRVLFAVAKIDDPYSLNSTNKPILRIGTFVNATIEGRLMPNLIALPRNLLRADNQLWVIDKNLRLQNRKVTILRTEGPLVYITSGLNEGELICQSIVTGSAAGTTIRVAKITLSNNNPSNQHIKQPNTNTSSKPIELAPPPPSSSELVTPHNTDGIKDESV